ncbi:MAG: hypothetical protein ACLSG9_03980 [Eubacterium sp.]
MKKYGGVPPYKETTNYVKKIKKFMQEGVTVPNRKVSTTSDAYEGSGASTGVEEKKTMSQSTDTTAVKATASDFEKVTVAVGTGDNAVTMTYGAYLKYLGNGEHRRRLMRHSSYKFKKEDFAWQSDRGYHFSTASFRIL